MDTVFCNYTQKVWEPLIIVNKLTDTQWIQILFIGRGSLKNNEVGILFHSSKNNKHSCNEYD